MSQLTALREQIGTLRRRRRLVRVGAALSFVAIAMLWALAAVFLLDWQLEMSRPQRAITLAIAATAMIWLYRKRVGPMLRIRETELDIALLVERQQGIDSDLVAALQFELPEAARWGSKQLEAAVVSYVVEFSEDFDALAGFSVAPLIRRGSVCAAIVAIFICAICWQPYYATTFLNHLLMGSRHYPSQTSIDELQVNGQIVTAGEVVRIGFGQPVQFAVRLSGTIQPENHIVRLTSLSSGNTRPIELSDDNGIKSKLAVADRANRQYWNSWFHGQLPELVESLEFQVVAGDAWTEPSRLDVIALPIVEPKFTATPPPYAGTSAGNNDLKPGALELSVLEDSQVGLSLVCLNKRLLAATLSVANRNYSLAAINSDRRHWTLPHAGSPLAQIDRPLHYEIQVTDEDGLQLPRPIAGEIRIKSARPPRIEAWADVKLFLPNGQPEIQYKVDDDFGISAIRAIVGIHHRDAAADRPVEKSLNVATIPLGKPMVHPRLPLSGQYRLPLSTFKLKKGDELKVKIEATGYRGNRPGQPTRSDPISLQITDDSGILAAIGQIDAQAARQLDLLIDGQMQVGGLK